MNEQINTNNAIRFVRTISDAVVIAGLEMFDEPELMRYVTKKNELLKKNAAQRAFKTKVVRRVLKSNLSLKSSQQDVYYCVKIAEITSLPDQVFLDAINKMRNVFNDISFADFSMELSKLQSEAA